MKTGAVSGSWWLWARGGDYGQESSLPAAALLLAGSLGLDRGFCDLHIPPSAEHTQISGFGWKMLPGDPVEEMTAGSCLLLQVAVSGEEG